MIDKYDLLIAILDAQIATLKKRACYDVRMINGKPSPVLSGKADSNRILVSVIDPLEDHKKIASRVIDAEWMSELLRHRAWY